MFKRPRKVLAQLLSNNVGSGIGQAMLDGAPFVSQLKTSIIPQRGTATPSFTRATVATVTDHEGILRSCLSGEARFTGARRVRNLVPVSEDFNAASVTRVNGTASGKVFTATSSGAYLYQVQSAVVSGNTYTARATLSLASGSKATSFWVNGTPASPNPKETLVTITTVPQTVQFTFTAAASATVNLGVGGYTGSLDNGMVLTISDWQLEDVTGQSVKTAGEYVSVGVLSAPYHGAGVDGVKYFDTTLAGNPIPTTTLKGYLAEEARTNKCQQSNTWTVAAGWTLPGMTSTTQNALGVDGKISAWTCLAAAGTTSRGVYMLFPATAAAWTVTAFLKKGTSEWVGLGFGAGTTVDGAFFNLTAGAIGTVAAGTTARISPAPNGFYRCEVTKTLTVANYYVQVEVHSTDNQSTSWTAAGTETIIGMNAQAELGAFSTTYTAVVAEVGGVTRNKDELTYTGALFATLKSLACSFERASGVTGFGIPSALTDGTNSNWISFYLNNSATDMQFTGTGGTGWVDNRIGGYTPGTRGKTSWTVSAGAQASSLNGVAGTAKTAATLPSVTTLNVGHIPGATFYPLNGNVGGIYGWTRNLSQAELNGVTK